MAGQALFIQVSQTVLERRPVGCPTPLGLAFIFTSLVVR